MLDKVHSVLKGITKENRSIRINYSKGKIEVVDFKSLQTRNDDDEELTKLKYAIK